MRTTVAGLLLVGVALAGCAGPQKIAEGAQRHAVAAAQARAVGDYERAMTEQQAADRQWIKACDRARAYYGTQQYVAYCAYR